MYLSRLEIQGFKSFAQKTVFEFPEKSHHDAKAKSITAIVGPNGSGKSNCSDAIRWVMGEQSLKLLRCKKADDVIFGGSPTKARQGVAEVSMVFNNEDHELPIDFAEVVLTRRVYRDGEGEYLINKKKVKLFDILMLLAKSNFGQKSYSIVGQGMVDHIINISPYERKDFFDEATGVKQYQIKRDQAVNKLRRSRENLSQTNQIMQELEPRLRLLTRQIKKLEKRQELEFELKGLQEKYYAHIWQNLQKNRKEQKEQFGVQDALKKNLEIELTRVQDELAQMAREESRKDVYNELQKDYNRHLSEKNELLKELALVKGKMNLEYVKAGQQNLSWLEDKKEEIEKRLAEIQESRNNADNRWRQKKGLLSENESQIAQINQELQVLENNLQLAQSELDNIKKGGKVNFALESVKALLRQKDFIKGVCGTVSQLGTVEEMYEAALSSAAGGKLNALIVKDDETAVRCIKYLKKNKLAPVTFLPLNKLKVTRPDKRSKELLQMNGAIGFAVDLLAFDPKYAKAFEFVFSTTIVVDNEENAKAIGAGKERMVTLAGDIFERSGMIKGGYRESKFLRWRTLNSQEAQSTQSEKIREIALLESKLNEKRRQKELLGEEIQNCRVEIEVADTKLKGLNNDFDELQKEKNKIQAEIAENQLAPEDQDEFMKLLNKKKNEFDERIEAQEKFLVEIRKKIDEFNLEEEKKKAVVFRLQKEMQEHQMKLNEVNQLLNEVNIALAKLDTKKEDLEKEIQTELGSEVNLNEIKLDSLVNVDQLWFQIGKIKHNLEIIGGIDPEIEEEHKEVSERYEFLSKQVVDLEKSIDDLEKIVLELDAVINKQFDTTFKKINSAFQNYFSKIFDGGKAKLQMVQKEKKEIAEEYENQEDMEQKLPENKSKLVNTGIEIMVAPPNKKINNIAVLSGGERTMTSLALICAIIESNPAPFIVMDEVDAALDEANSEKLARILQELSYRSQFVVITHNRVIMHVSDVLYGVAMSDDGVSKIMSLNLEEAKKAVEEK